MNTKNSLTLNIYMGRQFLLNVFFTTLALLMMLGLIQVLATLQEASGNVHLTTHMLFMLVALRMPDLVLQIVPFTILIGTLICFTRMTRTHELVAMRASGVSAWQFLLAPALVCLFIGVFNVLVMSPFSASTLKKYEVLHSALYPGSAKGLIVEGGTLWLRQPDANGNLIIRAGKVVNQGRDMKGVTLYQFDKSGAFQSLTAADDMSLEHGQWALHNAVRLSSDTPAENVPDTKIPTDLTVKTIESGFTSPNALSVWELPEFIKILQENGLKTSAHVMYLQRMLASPFLNLAMFILAVPFALRLSRRGGVSQLLVAGLLCGFGCYLLANVIGAYGLSGRLPVLVAAWIPVPIIGFAGIALLLHFGEE